MPATHARHLQDAGHVKTFDIAEQIGLNLFIQPNDLAYGEFFDKGGRIGAMRALGKEWLRLVEEMNQNLSV